MKHLRLFYLLLAAGLFAPGSALSQDAAPDPALVACLTGVGKADLAAKTKFQNALADLVVKNTDGSMDSLASLNRDLQTALAGVRYMELEYVIKNDITRFKDGSTLARFMNFKWTTDDEGNLLSANPDYSALQDKVKALTTKSDNDPGRPALRAKLIELQQTKDFAKIFADFNAARAKIQDQLINC